MSRAEPPPPKLRWPALAVRTAMKLDPLRLFEHGFGRHGDTVLYDTGHYHYVVVANPEAAEHILLRNYANFAKSADHPVFNRMLGQGVIMTNGDRWRQQRKALARAFQPRQLGRLVEGMAQTTAEFVEAWTRRSRPEIDVYDELSLLTRRVVGRALFGTRGDQTGGDLGRALDVMVERANLRGDRPWHLPLRYPTPRNRLFHRSIETIERFVYRLIDERRGPHDKTDVLAMLMSSHEDSDVEKLDDTELRDQILNLFLAGFETSASGLTWTFMLLARYPEVTRKVLEEVEQVVGDGPVQAEHLPQLQYLGWVLNEAMRLYPPIWTNERVLQEDDTINGHHIPRGTMVAVSTWLLHHHPALWTQPRRFDPERFSDERSEGRNRYAFAPFGLGPRTCVGNHFATMQAKVMVATIVRRMVIDVTSTDVEPLAAVTLRPRGGLRGRLRPRRGSSG